MCLQVVYINIYKTYIWLISYSIYHVCFINSNFSSLKPKIIIYIYIFFFLEEGAVPGLCDCPQCFLLLQQARNCSLVLVDQLLNSVASLGAEHRLSSCRLWDQQLWCTGLAAPGYVGSSLTRGQTCVSCIGKQMLNHWTTREVLKSLFFKSIHFSQSPFLSPSI